MPPLQRKKHGMTCFGYRWRHFILKAAFEGGAAEDTVVDDRACGRPWSVQRRGGCLSIPKGAWYHDMLSGILLHPCELHQHPFFVTSSLLRSIGI